jgi:hypothetical protein
MKRIIETLGHPLSDRSRALVLKADRARRIDRLIDYFGDRAPVLAPTRTLAVRPMRSRHA